MIIAYGTINLEIFQIKSLSKLRPDPRVEITIGHEEYCLGDSGSLAATSAGSDNDVQVSVASRHQSAFGTCTQLTILCRFAAQ